MTEFLAGIALAASGVGVWQLDVSLARFRCDPLAARFYGFTDTEARVGVTIARLMETFHPDDLERMHVQRQRSHKEGGLLVVEHRTIPGPGVVRWLLVCGRYAANASGEIVEGSGIVIDVTDTRTEGDAERRAFLMASDEEAPPLDRAADHVIAACKALDEDGSRPMLKAIAIFYLKRSALSLHAC